MHNYNSIADTQNNVLWSRYGEVLRLLDSDSISMNYLTEVLKRPFYKPRFRLFLLNPDETVDYEIPESDIILNSGNFTENYQNGQRKSLNINLINLDGRYTPGIDTFWVHSKFRFDVGLEFDDGVYWFPRGVYILGNPSSTHQISDKQVSLTLLDKFAIFESKAGTLEATYEIPAGTEIKQAILGILTLNSGKGDPLDLKPIIYDASFEGATMPYTLSKDAGSTLGEMLLEIGTILNAEVFYNSQGNLCFISINESTFDSQKASLWDYSEEDRDYYGSVITYDFENAINEVHVVGDNINEKIFSASAQNNNPNSLLCVEKIGRRIEYINDSDIYSDDLAQKRADYELRKNSILRTTISLDVSFNPLLFVNNLLILRDSHYGFDGEKFLIQSISYNIGDDCKMSVSCSNVVNFTNEYNLEVFVQEVYKRRILVGDNLNGKRLYFNFPNNISDIIISLESSSPRPITIIGMDSNSIIEEGMDYRPISLQHASYIQYLDYNSEKTQDIFRNDPINNALNTSLSSLILTENVGNVDYILNALPASTETPYEYIFIEDEFIRPIQVGDDLRGAKIYFNFPRDIYKKIIENDYNGGIISESDGSFIFSSIIGSQQVSIGCVGKTPVDPLAYLNIYNADIDGSGIGTLSTNLSVYEYDDASFNLLGVVGKIDNKDLSQYILVDIRSMPSSIS